MKQKYQVSLVDQQLECELNFHKIIRILPQLEVMTEPYIVDVSVGIHERQVSFEAIEQTPYTTLLKISLCDIALNWLPPSTFRVRVYRDAQMAEVVDFCGQRHFRARYGYPNAEMYHPDEKAQLNRHLGEWLAYCLSEGRAAKIL